MKVTLQDREFVATVESPDDQYFVELLNDAMGGVTFSHGTIESVELTQNGKVFRIRLTSKLKKPPRR